MTTAPPPSGSDAMTAPATRNGGHCEGDLDCASGHCVMGLCCATACDKESPESCGMTGACDESGTCKRYGKETTCLSESCSAATGSYTAPIFCDGTGAPCSTVRTTMSCDGAPCEGSHCQMGCGAGKSCAPGNFCRGGTCALQKATASACSDGVECASGFCVDGMCCNSACTQKCYSCSTGTCAPIRGPSPMDCPPGPGLCGNTGACDGSGGCVLPGKETRCSEPRCATSTDEETAGKCSGGQCVTDKVSCNGRFCRDGGCRPCSDGCVGDRFCDPSGQCVAPRDSGQRCTDDAQCKTRHCTAPGSFPDPAGQRLCCDSCGDGKHCNSKGKCKSNIEASCKADGDCDADEASSVKCVFTCSLTGVNCSSSVACPTGETCNHSFTGRCIDDN
jgi:hypothetical protein